MQLSGRTLCRRLFFDASSPSPKNRISTSASPPISSLKSAIPLQPPSTHIPETAEFPRLLSLSFNGHTFYRLSDILAYINDYPVGLQRVELYCDMVEQTAANFDIGSVFATGLIIAVKKDKSWAIVHWNAKDVAQLVDPLTRHHKADLVGRNRHEEVLRLINKHWGLAIAIFFHARHESEKTLCQLGQVARDNFSYADARLLVNSRIIEKILSRPSTPRTAFKTRTSD